MKKKNSRDIRKNTVIGLALIVILALTIGAIRFIADKQQITKNQGPSHDGINFDPPTKEDKQEVDENKQRIVEGQSNTPTPTSSSGKKQVIPTITYAGQYGDTIEVGAFVPSIIENNGTCTLTLSKDTVTKTVTVSAVNDASSTDCPVMSIPNNQLTSGKWSAKVSYSSPTAEGVSEPRDIEVK